MMLPTVTTVTLNPTVDMSSEAERVRPTHKVRTRNERLHPGGGGINVARVLHRLGVPVEALYLAGGASGAVLDDLLARINLPCRKIPIAGETRLSLTVHEQSSGLEYRFVPEGPCASGEELAGVLAAVEACRSDWLVLSGSLPSCAPDDFYARLVVAARTTGARVALDSSGPELAAAVAAGGLELIKPSRSELEGLAGTPLADHRAMALAANDFVRAGKVRQLVVTLGHEGALLVTAAEAWFLPAVPVDAQSAVGAGDSFLAAMIASFARGEEHLEAFRQATAAGAAAASTPGTDLCHPEQIKALLPRVGRPESVDFQQ